MKLQGETNQDWCKRVFDEQERLLKILPYNEKASRIVYVSRREYPITVSIPKPKGWSLKRHRSALKAPPWSIGQTRRARADYQALERLLKRITFMRAPYGVSGGCSRRMPVKDGPRRPKQGVAIPCPVHVIQVTGKIDRFTW